MRYRKLGNSTIEVSVLGVGALHFGVFCDQKATNDIVARALELGINFIDVAPMYGSGSAEMMVKNAIKGRRDKVILATKVGLNPKFALDGTFGVEVMALTRKNIFSSLDKSLQALGTDHVDLFQVHAFDASTPLEETWSALTDLVGAGKARWVGSSNYDHNEIARTQDVVKRNNLIDFVSLQCHYNLIERRAEQDIVPACLSNNYGIICYRALCRGILSGRYKNDQPLPEGSRAQISNRVRRWLTRDTLSLTQALEDFAREKGMTLPELSIAWLLERPAVAMVLAGMRNSEQLEVCVSGANARLTPQDMADIDDIIAALSLRDQVNSLPKVFLEK